MCKNIQFNYLSVTRRRETKNTLDNTDYVKNAETRRVMKNYSNDGEQQKLSQITNGDFFLPIFVTNG